MKYTLISLKALLIACSLAGCQQKEEIPGAGGTGQGLTFQASLEGEEIVQTKAYSNDINLITTGFTVAGYHTEGQFTSNPSEATPNVLNRSKDNNQAVHHMRYDPTAKKFQVELPEICGTNTIEDGMYISYFAWSQGNTESGYGITASTSSSSKGFPYLDVNLCRPDKTQGDIVAAQALDFPNDYVVTAIDLDFHHLLSKLTFLVTNNTGTTMKITDVQLNFGSNQIYSKARYSFNCSDSVGNFNSHTDYYASGDWKPSGWITPELPNPNPTQLGEALIVPQKLATGAITIKITYTINGKAPITRNLPLKDITLCQGKNYIYTLDIHTDQAKVINAIVGKWNESPTGSLPLVPGPCGDDILILEGTDMPYEYNGRKYWLDRSGYNNHCEIINTGDPTKPITWDESKKGYIFEGVAGNHIKVPNLGIFDGNMLCELICSVEHDAAKQYPTPFEFNAENKRQMLACIRHNFGDIVLDYGSTTSSHADADRLLSTPDPNWKVNWANKAFYAFRRQKGGHMSLARNNTIFQEKEAQTTKDRALLNDGIIGNEWVGQINYVKITRANVDMKKITEHYEKLAQDYTIKDEVETKLGTHVPPVRLGLVLCYDGREYDNATWTDQSLYKRHLLKTSVSKPTKTSNNSLSFSGNQGFYFEQSNFFDSQSFTLEIVSRTNFDNRENTIITFNPNRQTADEGNRQIHAHMPWGGSFIAFNSPRKNELDLDLSNVNDFTKAHKYNFIRNSLSSNTMFMEIWQDGVKNPYTHWTGYTTPSKLKLEPIGYFVIGGQWDFPTGSQPFQGEIFSIRLYNRVLTPEEIQQNYNYDKTEFGL